MTYLCHIIICVVFELQARIAEYIRQKNIQENYETAYEHNPEVFASVTMLYVNMEVGNSFPC